MKQAVHLLDPVSWRKRLPEYITTRCGYITDPEKIKTTANPEKVTCIKCKSYINNPWRVLRKYGKVKVVEDFFVMFWGDYGYRFDMAAMTDVPGTWNIIVSYRGQLHLNLTTCAGNMAQLGFKLVDIIEKEIIGIAKTTTPARFNKSPFSSPFAKGDEEPETSIQKL